MSSSIPGCGLPRVSRPRPARLARHLAAFTETASPCVAPASWTDHGQQCERRILPRRSPSATARAARARVLVPFELQVRSLLMTNHVSLSVMRAARLPAPDSRAAVAVADAAYSCLAAKPGAEAALERAAAAAYGLDHDTWSAVVDMFGVDGAERRVLESAWRT